MNPRRTPSVPHVRYYDVHSADGTRLRAWTNDADGPTVLLCNGLGTNPHSWPSVLDRDCGVRIISWNHRGVSGSERPANGRTDHDSYVEDAVAVLNDAGVESAVIASWSHGVTIAFEIATRFPERVDGILAVAGVPGDTFSTMLAPFHLPSPVAKQAMIALTRGGYLVGGALAPVTRNIPWTLTTVRLVQAVGFVGKEANPDDVRIMLKEFCTTDPRWYASLALHVAKGGRISLSGIDVPVTFIGGKQDILTGSRAMRSASQRIAHSRFLEVKGSHFLPLERPQLVLDELISLTEKAAETKPTR